jgi:hypothetical protein
MKHYEFEQAPHDGVKGYEFYTHITKYLERHGKQSAIDDFVNLMPWGTPTQVLEKFDNIREMIGTNAVMPAFSYGAMPYEAAEASLRLFAEKCLPELKSWSVPPLEIPAAAA